MGHNIARLSLCHTIEVDTVQEKNENGEESAENKRQRQQ